jgi:coenzyme F420-reducing hydrogenase alpha subunit
MSDWKWKQSSDRAFSLVSQLFGFNPDTLYKVKDRDATKLLKQADESEIQVKRTQDAVKAVKKTWRNNLRVSAAIHSLVNTGLGIITQQIRLESKTTKESAKMITETRVLSAKTNTAVEKTYLKGAKQIEKTGKDLQRFTGELNDQYNVIDQTANTASQQRRVGYRDRVQKRLTANSRPWRNY